jgi:HSP20 family molecular chaperone IbpA
MTRPKTVPAPLLYRRLELLDDRIVGRAQALARARDAVEGFGIDDWFRAESEILLRMPFRCEKREDGIVVRVDLPSVSPEDIDVGIETNELAVGVRGTPAAFGAIELPEGVDPARARTAFENGVLTVVLPRRGVPEQRTKRSA